MTVRALALLGLLCLLAACAARGGTAKPEVAVADREFEGPAAGRQYFEARCGRCHDLPDPKSEPPSEWPYYVDEMAERAHLDARSKQLVTLYLVAASQAAGGAAD